MIYSFDPKTNKKFGNPFEVADNHIIDRALQEAERDFEIFKEVCCEDSLLTSRNLLKKFLNSYLLLEVKFLKSQR